VKDKNLQYKNILITGGRAPATLHLARLLKQKKHRVYIADTFARNLASVSQYVDKSFVIPPPRQAPKGFVNQMRIIIKDYDIDIIIPTCEETFHVSLHRPAFEKYCQVFTSDIATLDKLHHKWTFNQLLKKIALPYPKSFLTTSLEETLVATKKLEAFVAKPTYSRFADKVIINDPNELNKIVINTSPSWIIQDYIDGDHFCSFSIAKNGKLSAHSVYPVSYRVENGAAVYFEAINVREIECIVSTIVTAINYTGFISFDFIRNKKDDAYYCLECNPRLTSGIHLFDNKDSFMPFSSAADICYPKAKNRMMLTLAMLSYNLIEQRSLTKFRDLIRAMRQADDVVFNWKDLRPFFAQFSSVLYFYKIAKQNNISILEATTHHIEWNGDSDMVMSDG
jgi:predicted ATP-grasp superfamily ATP-dependent carboligase